MFVYYLVCFATKVITLWSIFGYIGGGVCDQNKMLFSTQNDILKWVSIKISTHSALYLLLSARRSLHLGNALSAIGRIDEAEVGRCAKLDPGLKASNRFQVLIKWKRM